MIKLTILEQWLQPYFHSVGDDNYAVNEGAMLVYNDPSDRTDAPKVVELLALVEDEGEQFVVLSFYHIEDALWLRRDTFDPQFDVYTLFTKGKR